MTIHRFTVPENVPEPARTLLNVLQAVLKVNRKQAEQLVHDGAVRINNRVATQVHRFIDTSDQLSVDYVPAPSGPTNQKMKSTAGQAPFTILYDDDAIIVVNKAAGLLTVPTPYREPKTLLGLLNKYQDRKRAQERVHCVHRLDRGVSGVLVFAKSVEIAMQLRDQFAARKPERVYACIVAGKMDDRRGRFESYLATDDDLNRYSTKDSSKGQLAITHWQTEHEYANATLLKVELETGRRNQIRVHLAESGHPVLGDPRYESDLAKHARWPYKRIALHAESLGFKHPATSQPMKFQTEWPQEFRSFHKSMRDRGSN
jgi:23S rRNA pseudouridine1911/1915/1917 synthase